MKHSSIKHIRIAPAITICLIALLTVACGKQTASTPAVQATLIDVDGNLALPVMPDSLTLPSDRADWLAAHFWDTLDFTDTIHSLDTMFMEQTFANYSTVLPLAEQTARAEAVSALLDRARTASTEVYTLLFSIAEHYLYEPDSPVYDEESFLPFADYALRLSGGTDPVARSQREDIIKNRPGTMAPNFTFTSRNGNKEHLLRSGSRAGILLMFYEPDCEQCLSAIEVLRAESAIDQAIADGALRLVAVHDGFDRKQWKSHAATLPPAWEVGIDADGTIADGDLYLIRATPSFYLIAPDGTIILKDAPLRRILSALLPAQQ